MTYYTKINKMNYLYCKALAPRLKGILGSFRMCAGFDHFISDDLSHWVDYGSFTVFFREVHLWVDCGSFTLYIVIWCISYSVDCELLIPCIYDISLSVDCGSFTSYSCILMMHFILDRLQVIHLYMWCIFY